MLPEKVLIHRYIYMQRLLDPLLKPLVSKNEATRTSLRKLSRVSFQLGCAVSVGAAFIQVGIQFLSHEYTREFQRRTTMIGWVEGSRPGV